MQTGRNTGRVANERHRLTAGCWVDGQSRSRIKSNVNEDRFFSQLRLGSTGPGPAGRLGTRILIPEDLKQKLSDLIGAELVDASAYEAHRIALGVPRGGLDFMYSDAFPHETNMDRLAGVDFDKGCYVGQEVVSRMQHRGTARTRSVKVLLDDLSPEAGVSVMAGDKPVGTMGSSAQGKGIALVRIDRVADALDAGQPLTAGGLALTLAEPEVVRIPAKQPTA